MSAKNSKTSQPSLPFFPGRWPLLSGNLPQEALDHATVPIGATDCVNCVSIEGFAHGEVEAAHSERDAEQEA
ncbi:uncharacterized protein VTP21DRAFT_1058 [Calcarisporiella thermophila]|uniref:uncharacterized protein n=1 Tax=Calcarisporiella thermophila TaxID=911321 RepID=UPI00374345B6